MTDEPGDAGPSTDGSVGDTPSDGAPSGSADYAVGYGKPPKHTRFKPGQSGNPKGRPRGARNLKTDLIDELGQKISLREDGKSIRVSKQRAMVKALAAKAIKGDARAANSMISMILRLLHDGQDADEAAADLTAEDWDLLLRHAQRRALHHLDGRDDAAND